MQKSCNMEEFKKWFSIIRPKTLFASLVPILLSIFMAYRYYSSIGEKTEFSFSLSIIVLLCGVSLQVLSNLINDYYDFTKGLDKKDRLGPKRALAEGTITQSQMKKAIYINILFSLLSGLVLILKGGVPVLIIGLSAILFAWLYTATPYSLSYLGIADIFAFLYYGPVASVGTFYILTGSSTLANYSSVFFASCVCGCISTMILTVNNIRDISSDKIAGKRTIGVRFGKKVAEGEYLVCVCLTCVFSCLAFGVLSLTNMIFVLGLILFFRLKKAEGLEYNKMLFYTSLLNLAYIVLYLLDRLFLN